MSRIPEGLFAANIVLRRQDKDSSALLTRLQSKLQSTHHLATEGNFVKVKQLSQKKTLQCNRWIFRAIFCINCMSVRVFLCLIRRSA